MRQLFNRRYTLHEAIGTGGMGTVYRATDFLTGQDVALKLVNTEPDPNASPHLSTRDLRAHLADEFRLLAALDHPHIIQVADYGVAGEQPFFTMQLLHNPVTIVEAARQTDLQGRLTLMVQVLHAIEHVHQRGILHRDIKPSNILVADGHSYLVDFGLAIDRPSSAPLGTLLYIAPELLQGKAATAAADIYALACVFCEVLSDRPLYDLPPDATNSDLINAILLHPIDLEAVLPPTLDDPSGKVCTKLRTLLQAMLERDPKKRLTNITTLRQRFSGLLETPLALSPDNLLKATKFVGRKRELARLQAALDRVKKAAADVWAFLKVEAYEQGVGSSWLVGGESGVGKTRLFQQLAALALTADCLVLHGQAFEDADPLLVWHEPLRRLVLSLEISADESAALRSVVPDIDRLTGHDRATPPPAPAERALAFRNTVLALLQRLNQPTLLILDDIQWAGRELLHTILQLVPDLPLVVVIGFRDDEYPALYEEFADATPLRLAPLNRVETAELVESLIGKAPPAFVDWLQRQTEGNTFFLVETLRTLAIDHGLRKAAFIKPPSGTILPTGIFPLLQRRLKHITDDDQRLLQMAATLGYELDLAVLRCLNGFQPLEGWLKRCYDAALLTTRNTRWQFIHDKLRVAILHSIPADEKTTLYRRVAIGKASLHAENPQEAQLLMQLWQVAGDEHQAYRYAAHAARHARATADFTQASQLYAAARRYTDYVSCRLLLEHADVLFQLGHFEDALESASLANDVAQGTSDVVCTAHVMYHKARLNLAKHQYEDVITVATDALVLYRRLEMQRETAYCLVLMGTAFVEMGSVRAAIQYHRDALEAFEAQADIGGMLDATIMLGVDALVHENLEDAQDFFEAADALATSHNRPGEKARALFYSGVVLMKRGRTLRAVSRLVQALDMVQSQGRLAMEAQIKARLAECYRHLNEHRLAYRHYADALDASLRVGPNQTATFEVLVGIGHLAVAEGHAERAAWVVGHLQHHTGITQAIRSELEHLYAVARDALDAEMLHDELSTGATLSTDALVLLVKQMLNSPSVP